MNFEIHKSFQRGHADHGWLKTAYSFTFSTYMNFNRMQFGVLRVVNDDYINPGGGFGMHPHNNMEIITIPLSGALTHRDSMGNTLTIQKGEVQVMSAGTGIMHSEANLSETDHVALFQIWIYPEKNDVEPRYQQISYDESQMQNQWVLLVSQDGKAGSAKIHQDAKILMGKFDAGKNISYFLNDESRGVFIMVVEGKIEIEGEEVEPRDSAEMSDTSKVDIKILEAETRLLLIEVPMEIKY